jgi:hypothetical protein
MNCAHARRQLRKERDREPRLASDSEGRFVLIGLFQLLLASLSAAPLLALSVFTAAPYAHGKFTCPSRDSWQLPYIRLRCCSDSATSVISCVDRFLKNRKSMATSTFTPAAARRKLRFAFDLEFRELALLGLFQFFLAHCRAGIC